MNDQWSESLARQPALFAPRLRRSQLFPPVDVQSPREITIRVWRNTPFEFIAQATTPFLAFSRLRANFHYSDYDDTFQTSESIDADVHLVSFDLDHYELNFQHTEFDVWFANQLTQLRTRTSSPILVTNWVSEKGDVAQRNLELAASIERIPGVFVVDAAGQCTQLQSAFWDARMRPMNMTGWSDLAVLHVAREIGLRLIPAALGTRIKAIVVDFDDTLVEGVIAEDGVTGVGVTGWHRQLHDALKRAKANGILLAIASQNVCNDVEEFFDSSTDTILKRDDFDLLEVNWKPKSVSIRKIASQFNFATSDILFVDDNVGHLAEVSTTIPDCQLLLASSTTSLGIDLFPGIHRLRITNEDRLRSADIEANRERTELAAQALSPAEYMRSLGVRLQFRVNDASTLPRLAELSTKTNQFNLSLSRLTERAIEVALAENSIAVAVAMRDRLSDSGTIGFLLLEPSSDQLRVRELCISCRALGRGLEGLMIFGALRAAGHTPVKSIEFDWNRGPRNQPALDWISQTSHFEIAGDGGSVSIPWSDGIVEKLLEMTPVTIEEN